MHAQLLFLHYNVICSDRAPMGLVDPTLGTGWVVFYRAWIQPRHYPWKVNAGMH